MAPEIVNQTLEHEDWEAFSRMRMQEGGALSKYYPLSVNYPESHSQIQQLQNQYLLFDNAFYGHQLRYTYH